MAFLALPTIGLSDASADVDFVRALKASAPVRDPCPESAKPGWQKLDLPDPTRKEGISVWDISMTVLYDGKRIVLNGPSFPKTTIYDLCRNKWQAAPAKSEIRPGTQNPHPSETIALGEGASLHLRLSSQWYHAFDEARIKRKGRREVAVRRENSPSARRAYAFSMADSRVMIWGGLGTSTGVLGDGAVLDLQSGRWRRITGKNAPSARFSPVTALHDGKLVIWGGFAHENKVVSGKVVGGQLFDGAIYDPRKDQWARIPPLPGRFQNLPVAVLAGTDLVLAGADLEKKNPAFVAALNLSDRSWHFIKDAPVIHAPRLEAHALGGSRELVVERDLGGNIIPNKLYRLSLATDSMEQIEFPDELKGMSGVHALWTGKRLFVLGGYVMKSDSCPDSRKEGDPRCLPAKPVVERWNSGWVFVP